MKASDSTSRRSPTAFRPIAIWRSAVRNAGKWVHWTPSALPPGSPAATAFRAHSAARPKRYAATARLSGVSSFTAALPSRRAAAFMSEVYAIGESLLATNKAPLLGKVRHRFGDGL